jgi:hypothetical protein
MLRRAGPTPVSLEPGINDEFRGAGLTLRFLRDGAARVLGFVAGAGRVRDIRFVKR